MSTEAFLLIREAADGMTSLELADALRCSQRSAVVHLVRLRPAGDVESTGAFRDGAAIFRMRTAPLQLGLPIYQ